MLSANIGEMLQQKTEKVKETNNTMTWEALDRHVKVERRKKQEHIETLARQRQRQHMIQTLRQLRKDRDQVVIDIQQLTIIRKDGKNVARPNSALQRKSLQYDLECYNTKIDNIQRKLNPPKPKVVNTYWQARKRRDELVCKLVNNKSHDKHTDRLTITVLNEDVIRPERGYPKPPFVRTEDYPEGGLWHAPKGGITKRTIKEEHSRLVLYYARMVKKHGKNESTNKMLNHICYLEHMFVSIPNNTCIKRYGSGKYYRTVGIGR